jgi:hypothetical protein
MLDELIQHQTAENFQVMFDVMKQQTAQISQNMKNELNLQTEEISQKITQEISQINPATIEKANQIYQIITQQTEQSNQNTNEKENQICQNIKEEIFQKATQISNQLNSSSEGMKLILISLITKSILYQNSQNGILQTLKYSEPNSISLSCSSFCDDYRKPENIMNYDNSDWCSENESDSWLCIKFTSKQILLTGYFLRSFFQAGDDDPKSWKLLGSNDNVNWKMIEEQTNRDWVTKHPSEVYFPVEAKEPFSSFKFIQTGKNYKNRDHFQFSYVEFFGTIFSQ